MTVEAWALFCLTELVLCFHPGPAALVVLSQSLTNGPSAGVRATTGVLSANAIYFALSASGLVALHSLSAVAFSIAVVSSLMFPPRPASARASPFPSSQWHRPS